MWGLSRNRKQWANRRRRQNDRIEAERGLSESPGALAAERYERALREIVALVPDYEESRRVADERGAEVANALTVGAWRAAEVARKALGIDDERSGGLPEPETES